MNNKITLLQKTKLIKIAQSIVRQGPHHRENIVTFYRILRDEARLEFTEDNKPTLDSFLTECYSW